MGKVERHNAYVRRNPSGHKELVIKKKGKQDEETLNEIAESVLRILESMIYAGPLPAGGGAGSPEQLEYQRNPNQPDSPLVVGARGDQARAAGESPNNMTSSTQQAADGPETSRAKSKLRATAQGTPPRNKYISGYAGDNIDYGATHSESFTGTSAIGIAPSTYQVMDDNDESNDEDEENTATKSESVMSKKRVINEWDPAFQAAGYEPGDYQMPSPTGDGVAKRKPKQNTVGRYDTSTQNKGKEWPRKHNETAAMCDVDEDGVEGKPQGGHESSVGEPTDGIQTPVSHNWPNQPKLKGGGVAEPVEGSRWSDGGTLTGGSGQDELTYKKGGSGMPKKGPIKGTKGPQNGQPSESWSPELVGSLLGEDRDLQSLFDSYAHKSAIVCLEDFTSLCRAHGIDAKLDEASLLTLMRDNRQYIFYEGIDANGPYWTPTPIAEGFGNKPIRAPKDPKGTLEPEAIDDPDSEELDPANIAVQEGRRRRPFPVNEMQIRSPEEEAMLNRNPEREEDAEYGEFESINPHEQTGYEGDPDEDPEYAENDSNGPGPYGMHNAPYDECPECGYLGSDETCPECGATISSGFDENDLESTRPIGTTEQQIDDWDEEERDDWDTFQDESLPTPTFDDGLQGVDDSWEGQAESSRRMQKWPVVNPAELGEQLPVSPSNFADDEEGQIFDPDVQESVKRFMTSARNIIEQNSGADRRAVGEALTQSWQHYVPGFDARRAPGKVQRSLQELAKRFPRFNPLVECEAMDKLGGTAIGKTGGGPKDPKFLAPNDQPGMDDMQELGEPLGKKQKNNLEGTPTIKGTEKGLTGKTVKENVQRIAKYVQKQLQEGASSLRGKFGVSFTCLVQEGNKLNRTDSRTRLAEAVADVEELLQFHNSDHVVLEASFHDGRKVILTHRIPMLQIARRAPIMAEGSAIFRFTRHAERYAEKMMSEGHTCKLLEHNWGAAVRVLTEKKKNAKKACK